MCPFSEQQQRGSDKSVQSMIVVVLAEIAQEELSVLLKKRYLGIWVYLEERHKYVSKKLLKQK